MGQRAGAGERDGQGVRIWPLLAFAVGSMVWAAGWWWSQLRNAGGDVRGDEVAPR
jgi:hypothetical protein